MSVLTLAQTPLELRLPHEQLSPSSSTSSFLSDASSYVPPEVLEKIYNAVSEHSTSLDLSHCDLCDLPNELFEAVDLKTLILSNNNLKTLSPKISHLRKLQTLDLSNNYLNNLPFTIGNLPDLNSLNVSGNPLINLPKEIACIKDCRKILSYFKDWQTGTSSWGDVKLVFLGDLNAGKTSLMWSLINHKKKKFFTIRRRSSMVCVKTESIEMIPYANKSFTFTIWDFAGHTYYDIIQNVLSDNTCYVVTFNLTPQTKTDHDLQYWIDLVKDRTRSPIILVGTHMEFLSKEECTKMQQSMKARYPDYPFFMVNNKNYKGVQELGRCLKREAKEKIIKQTTIPSTFLCIKEWITDRKLNGQKFMTRQQFKEMIEDAGAATKELDCLRYLHDSSTVVFVEDATDESKSLLLLEPSFLVESWVALITSKQLLHDGFISVADLSKAWAPLHTSEETHKHLIETLMIFGKIRIVDNEKVVLTGQLNSQE